MADGKWITGLTPDMPAVEAARVVLAIRLSSVRHNLPLAADRAAESIEYVHQLRVATRRSGAALRLFRSFLLRKSYSRTRRTLRDLRRAAGDARDWDVFLDHIQDVTTQEANFLAGYALRERLAAQEKLVATVAAQIATVHELCSSAATATRPPEELSPTPSVGEHAAAVLGDLFAEFASEIQARPTEAEQLHQLRILAKRVRYAMEVFAGIYARPFRDVLYPAVEQLQEVLGDVQDAAVTAARLEQISGELSYLPTRLSDRLRAGLGAMAEANNAKAAQGSRKFREWSDSWVQLTAEHPLRELLSPVSP